MGVMRVSFCFAWLSFACNFFQCFRKQVQHDSTLVRDLLIVTMLFLGEKELMSRLLRPHLQAGDALLFDCRALHFGLANTSGNLLNTPGELFNIHPLSLCMFV
jgi:hypothetical protein